LGFGLRIFLIILTLIAAFTAGSIAARGINEVSFLGRHMIPELESTNSFFQVRVQSRVIIRVPRLTPIVAAGSRGRGLQKFSEKKGGKCYPIAQFVGFSDSGSNKQSIELVTRDGTRVRAYLGDGCLAREFYAGAYVEQSKDGYLCTDRDIFHARTGAKCEIEKFRRLVADK
jgi:hypothetical protein